MAIDLVSQLKSNLPPNTIIPSILLVPVIKGTGDADLIKISG